MPSPRSPCPAPFRGVSSCLPCPSPTPRPAASPGSRSWGTSLGTFPPHDVTPLHLSEDGARRERAGRFVLNAICFLRLPAREGELLFKARGVHPAVSRAVSGSAEGSTLLYQQRHRVHRAHLGGSPRPLAAPRRPPRVLLLPHLRRGLARPGARPGPVADSMRCLLFDRGLAALLLARPFWPAAAATRSRGLRLPAALGAASRSACSSMNRFFRL